MKKILFVIVLSFVLLTASNGLAFAEEFANPALIDEVGLLTPDQAAFINENLEAIRAEFGLDVAVYIEEKMSGYSAMGTADDIYDYGGYGAGSGYDGILLYISMDPREYHFTTHGYGMEAFTDNGLSYLESIIQPFLAEDNYYDALYSFCEGCDMLLEMASTGEPFDKVPFSLDAALFYVFVALIVPPIIAFCKMRGKLKKMKTAVSQSTAANYMKQGSMTLSASRDIYLYSNVTKVRRVQNNSSSSHTSSSGRTHGGRGGSF